MTSPSFDATFGAPNTSGRSGFGTNAFSFGSSAKTAGANRVIYAFMVTRSAISTVTSVTESSSTLTFVRVFKQINTNDTTNQTTLEVWAAQATSQFNAAAASITYTVTFNNTTQTSMAIILGAVTGLASTASPNDPNADNPSIAQNSTSTTPPTVTISTSNSDDLLLGIAGYLGGFSPNASFPPSGWTALANVDDATGSAQFLEVDYKSVSAPQSNTTYPYGGNGVSGFWVTAVLAVTADLITIATKAQCSMVGF